MKVVGCRELHHVTIKTWLWQVISLSIRVFGFKASEFTFNVILFFDGGSYVRLNLDAALTEGCDDVVIYSIFTKKKRSDLRFLYVL